MKILTYQDFEQLIKNGSINLKNNSGYIAKQLNVSEEIVKELREQHRENRMSQNRELVVKVSLQDLDTTPTIEQLESTGYKVNSSVNVPIAPKGFVVSSFSQDKVWYKKETEEEAVSNLDWNEIAKVIASSTEPVKLNITETDEDITQLICISDIHVGMKTKGWGLSNLNKTFQYLADNVKKGAFIEILCLGDTVDGMNGMTATKGSTHRLPQDMNNQEQILNTVKAFQLLFDNLAEQVKIGRITGFGFTSVSESNHSGDIDYVIAEFLRMWLNVKYPDVVVKTDVDYWGAFGIGKYNFFYSHGKDSSNMKYGLKLNLDDKTELYLASYFKKKFGHFEMSPKTDIVITGDLHTESFSQGKFFKYYKVPAMSPSSEWVKANFGYSLPGCQYFNIGDNLFETGVISFDFLETV